MFRNLSFFFGLKLNKTTKSYLACTFLAKGIQTICTLMFSHRISTVMLWVVPHTIVHGEYTTDIHCADLWVHVIRLLRENTLD